MAFRNKMRTWVITAVDENKLSIAWSGVLQTVLLLLITCPSQQLHHLKSEKLAKAVLHSRLFAEFPKFLIKPFKKVINYLAELRFQA